MRVDLLKPQLLRSQLITRSSPLDGATAVTVTGGTVGKVPADFEVRQTLWGLFSDGSERKIATLEWPNETTVTVHAETAVRVWVHIDGNYPNVTFYETIDTGD